jgi:hypothetical protein
MSKKGAQKTGSGDPGGKRKNSEMAAYMAKHGVRRTTMRDPISNRIVAIKATGSLNGRIVG